MTATQREPWGIVWLLAVTQIAYVEVGSNPISIAIDPTRKLAYVANDIDDTIAVIDTNAHTLVATIPCNQPFGVAVNPITNLIYVNSGGVQVIDGATRTIIANISTGAGAAEIAVDPALNKIFSINAAGGSLAVIDGTTNTVVGTVETGQRPWGIALSPDGTKLFTANGPSGDVSIVDLATNQVTKKVPVGRGPVLRSALETIKADRRDAAAWALSLSSSRLETGVNEARHWARWASSGEVHS